MDNYLQHHGTKGMKWGVRRYQNKDGSLTDAGKKRYDRDIRENDAKVKDKRIKIDSPDPDRWVKEDMTRTKKSIDSASSVVKNLKDVNDKVPKKKTSNVDLSNMSDKELRDKINRANLERQYREVCIPQKVSKGREFATKTLDYAGTALAISGSAVGLALTIKELRG